MSTDEDTASAHAAVIAASSVIASSNTVGSKGAYPRGPWSRTGGRQLAVPTRADIPRLLAGTGSSRAHRIARATAAALLYARKTEPAQIKRFLVDEHERSAVDKVEADRTKSAQWEKARKVGKPNAGRPSDYVHCRYCALLSAVLYQGGPPPALVVSHSAHVETTFDPDTNIAGASITGFKMLMPKTLAIKTIDASHPLNWAKSAPAIFTRSDAAVRESKDWQPEEGVDVAEWELEAKKSMNYLWEEVTWPWNDLIDTELINVIRITNFAQEGLPPPRAGMGGHLTEVSLSYDYSLESCLLTFLGINWERGGLNVDDGEYRGKAYDLNALAGNNEPFENITVGDLLQLGYQVDGRRGLDGKVDVGDARTAIMKIADQFKKKRGSNEDIWLTDVTASKQLRFTAPGDTPVELWVALTSMAPTLLFAFLNNAVCQTVHQVAPSQAQQAAASQARPVAVAASQARPVAASQARPLAASQPRPVVRSQARPVAASQARPVAPSSARPPDKAKMNSYVNELKPGNGDKANEEKAG